MHESASIRALAFVQWTITKTKRNYIFFIRTNENGTVSLICSKLKMICILQIRCEIRKVETFDTRMVNVERKKTLREAPTIFHGEREREREILFTISFFIVNPRDKLDLFYVIKRTVSFKWLVFRCILCCSWLFSILSPHCMSRLVSSSAAKIWKLLHIFHSGFVVFRLFFSSCSDGDCPYIWGIRMMQY